MEPAAGELQLPPVVEDLPQSVAEKVPEDAPGSDDSALFSSSAAPSESWVAANKYVLGALASRLPSLSE